MELLQHNADGNATDQPWGEEGGPLFDPPVAELALLAACFLPFQALVWSLDAWSYRGEKTLPLPWLNRGGNTAIS